MIEITPTSVVEALERWATLTPGKVAIICPEGSYTYEELNSEANHLASAWLNSGAKAGEIVCSFLPKGLAFAVCFFATQKANLVFASLDPNARHEIVTHHIKSLASSFFVLPREYRANHLQKLICESRPNAIISYPEITIRSTSRILRWRGLPSSGSDRNPNLLKSADMPCYLNFSSGATSFPKAAVGSVANIYWNSAAAIMTLGLVQSDVHLCTFPSFLHPHEILARSVYLGGSSVLVEFELSQLWQIIFRAEVTCVMSNPTVYGLLVDFAKRTGEIPPALRLAESGGSIPFESLSEAVSRYLGAKFVPVWGSAETMGIALAVTKIAQPLSKSTLGEVCPTYQIEVVDPTTDLEVAPGEPGEMRIRGPGVSSGYYIKNDNEKNPFRDGWYYTGDMITRDVEGCLFFSGRKHDMIKSRGFKVFPSEIETILRHYPGVKDAVVLGILDPKRGETIAALIVRETDASVSLKALVKFCKTRMESYKLPTRFRFISHLPIDPTAKLNRSQLASLFSIEEPEV